jgi:hypothetical protein
LRGFVPASIRGRATGILLGYDRQTFFETQVLADIQWFPLSALAGKLPVHRGRAVVFTNLYRLDELGRISVVYGDPKKTLRRFHRATKAKFMLPVDVGIRTLGGFHHGGSESETERFAIRWHDR